MLSRDEAEFVRRLRAGAVLARPRYAQGGRSEVVGYSIALRPIRDGAQPIWFGGVLILVDHPSISILRSIVCVLATDKSEPDRSGIVIRRRSDGAANAAAESVCIGEAVPVNVRRLQAAD